MQVFSRRTAGALQAAARRHGYSTATSGYAATAENLRINKDTKVIFQGFTGKQGRCVNRNAKFALASANRRTVSMPSRPLITVFTTLRYGTKPGIDWVQEPMLSVVQIQRKPERHIWESQYLLKSAMLSKRREQLHPRSSSREEQFGFYLYSLQRETEIVTDTTSDRHWPPQVSRKLSKQRCPL